MDYAATLLAKLPGASKRDHGLRRLVETLESYLTGEQIETIVRAYEFGAAAHDQASAATTAIIHSVIFIGVPPSTSVPTTEPAYRLP